MKKNLKPPLPEESCSATNFHASGEGGFSAPKYKRGDVRADGKVFWQMAKSYKTGEWWVSPEQFEKKKERRRELDSQRIVQNRIKRGWTAKEAKTKPSQRRHTERGLKCTKVLKKLRSRTAHAIGMAVVGNTVEFKKNILGCMGAKFEAHIESLFEPGMTWENHGEWHIDHIKPISSFNLLTDEGKKQAGNFKNLQPLWAVDNMRKGSME